MLAPASTPRPKTLAELLGREAMARLDRLDLLSRKVFAGKLPGERRSKRRGTSVEFDDYRNYVPGDDLRRVDWNVFARLDRFFLKLFREEEDLALHLVIDASASMDAGTPSKLVFAQKLAAALGYIGLVNHNRVLASIIGAPGRPLVQQLTPLRGRRNVPRLGQFLLEQVWPPEGHALAGGGGAPAGTFNGALRSLALARRGKGVMVVLSDFLVREDVRAGLNFLASGGGGGGGGNGGAFDVTCVQILSPGEVEPEREGGGGGGGVIGDLRFTDVETGLGAEVTVSGALLKRYKERLEEHIDSLRRACAARGMAHLLLRSDADVERVLLEYLRRRGLLG